MWDECNCVVIWTFFGIAFCWYWNGNWIFLLQDAWTEGLALIFSFENFKIATCFWKTINRRMLDPTKKRYPTSKGKGEAPKKMVGGVKSHLESNPIPSRDAWRPQAEPCVYQYPEIPQRLSQTCLWVFECLLRRRGSSVTCHRDKCSGCIRPGSYTVCHKPS